jgi:hypothetical protein
MSYLDIKKYMINISKVDSNTILAYAKNIKKYDKYQPYHESFFENMLIKFNC